MGHFCCIAGCSNRSERDKKSYYRVPAVITNQGEQTKELSTKRRNKWLANINRSTGIPPSTINNFRVCSDHFVTGKPAKLYEEANPDWAPTLKLGHDKVKDGNKAFEKFQRWKKRKERRADSEAAHALLRLKKPRVDIEPEPVINEVYHANQCTPHSLGNGPNRCNVECQTDLTGHIIETMEKELARLNKENSDLKGKGKHTVLNESGYKTL